MSVAMLLVRRRPGVSMAMNALPSSSKRTSTLSRVVPGTSLTIIRSAWASVLTNVLLPVLRRPTMATFITGSSATSRSLPSGGGQSLDDRLQAARRGCDSAVVLMADQLAAAELVELVGLGVELAVVGLVGHADDRHVDVAQPSATSWSSGIRPVAGIDDEQDDVGRVDGRVDLLFDLLGEIVGVLDAHAAGVDQLEIPWSRVVSHIR